MKDDVKPYVLGASEQEIARLDRQAASLGVTTQRPPPRVDQPSHHG
jgi:hypothetical protein